VIKVKPEVDELGKKGRKVCQRQNAAIYSPNFYREFHFEGLFSETCVYIKETKKYGINRDCECCVGKETKRCSVSRPGEAICVMQEKKQRE
jgi:hypothetical protein